MMVALVLCAHSRRSRLSGSNFDAFVRGSPTVTGEAMKWRITIFTADGQRLIFNTLWDDLKEIQALATEARSKDLSTKYEGAEAGGSTSMGHDDVRASIRYQGVEIEVVRAAGAKLPKLRSVG
jgi:hypothetical protein